MAIAPLLAALAAASSAAGIATGIYSAVKGGPEAPAPVPTPEKAVTPEDLTAQSEAIRAARRRRGVLATILTSTNPLEGAASAGKTLLGQ